MSSDQPRLPFNVPEFGTPWDDELVRLRKENEDLKARLAKYESQAKSVPQEGTTEETEEAVARSRKHANKEWFEAAVAEGTALAKRKAFIASADVRDLMDKRPETTHDLRAIGPVMRQLVKNGIIDYHGIDRARHTHGLLYNVWKSLIYEGEAADGK